MAIKISAELALALGISFSSAKDGIEVDDWQLLGIDKNESDPLKVETAATFRMNLITNNPDISDAEASAFNEAAIYARDKIVAAINQQKQKKDKINEVAGKMAGTGSRDRLTPPTPKTDPEEDPATKSSSASSPSGGTPPITVKVDVTSPPGDKTSPSTEKPPEDPKKTEPRIPSAAEFGATLLTVPSVPVPLDKDKVSSTGESKEKEDKEPVVVKVSTPATPSDTPKGRPTREDDPDRKPSILTVPGSVPGELPKTTTTWSGWPTAREAKKDRFDRRRKKREGDEREWSEEGSESGIGDRVREASGEAVDDLAGFFGGLVDKLGGKLGGDKVSEDAHKAKEDLGRAEEEVEATDRFHDHAVEKVKEAEENLKKAREAPGLVSVKPAEEKLEAAKEELRGAKKRKREAREDLRGARKGAGRAEAARAKFEARGGRRGAVARALIGVFGGGKGGGGGGVPDGAGDGGDGDGGGGGDKMSLIMRAAAGDPTALAKLMIDEGKARMEAFGRAVKGMGRAVAADSVGSAGSEAMGAGAEYGRALGSDTIATIFKFGKALFDAHEKLVKWTEQLHEGNMKFAEFSSAMAKVQAEAIARDIQLSKLRGDMQAEWAKFLAEQKSRREFAQAPWEAAFKNFQSGLAGGLNEFMANFMEGMNKAFGIDTEGPDQGFNMMKWIEEMGDAGWDASNYARPKRFPPTPGSGGRGWWDQLLGGS